MHPRSVIVPGLLAPLAAALPTSIPEEQTSDAQCGSGACSSFPGSGTGYTGGNTGYPGGGFPGGDIGYPGGGFPGGDIGYPGGGFPGGNTGYPGGGFPGGDIGYPGGGFPGGNTGYPGGSFPGGNTGYPGGGFPGGDIGYPGSSFTGGNIGYPGGGIGYPGGKGYSGGYSYSYDYEETQYLTGLGCPPEGLPPLHQLGYSFQDLQYFIEIGYRPQDFGYIGELGYPPTNLRYLANQGYFPDDLRFLTGQGFVPDDLLFLSQRGCPLQDLRRFAELGCPPQDIRYLAEMGYFPQDIQYLTEFDYLPNGLQYLMDLSCGAEDFRFLAEMGYRPQNFEYLVEQGYHHEVIQYLVQQRYPPTRLQDLAGPGSLFGGLSGPGSPLGGGLNGPGSPLGGGLNGLGSPLGGGLNGLGSPLGGGLNGLGSPLGGGLNGLGSPLDGELGSPLGGEFGSPIGGGVGSPLGSGFGSPLSGEFGSPLGGEPGSPLGGGLNGLGSPLGSGFGSPLGSGFGSPLSGEFGSPIGGRPGSHLGGGLNGVGSPLGSGVGSPLGGEPGSNLGGGLNGPGFPLGGLDGPGFGEGKLAAPGHPPEDMPGLRYPPEDRGGFRHGGNHACSGNTATTRSEWCGSFSIDTDYTSQAPDTGVTREYWLDISDVIIAPDGVPRTAMAVNGSMPGPTIFADWGDTVIVHVTNSLYTSKNGTSIHFHGIRQLFTNQNDGVPSITECPTAVGKSTTYTWRALQYGSTWYHSHFALQAWQGVFGGIVINGPATSNYDEDLGVVFLNDWDHQTVDELYSTAETQGPPPLANALINGTNVFNDSGQHLNIPFTRGKSHRLRLVNAAVDTHFKFTIDNHRMTVIATDLVPIRPYTTNVLNIGIGQRYDVIVSADQAHVAENFWMRAIPQSSCSNVNNSDNVRAVVHYGERPSTPSTLGYSFTDSCDDEKNLSPHITKDLTPTQITTSEFVNLTTVEGLFKWSLNSTSMVVDWRNPTLQQIQSGVNSFSQSNAVIRLPAANQLFSMVIETTLAIPHPIHLHGHDFFVLSQGTGNYSAETPLTWRNPPRRDTAMLPGNGFLVIAFETDNPGAWLMHCHIGWHTSEGFALQFVEREDEIAGLTNGKTLDSQCRAWNDFQDAFNIEQEDSGV
ncbi:multicopper oxidase domain-containing protein [Hirsutella rhossiliensis]|uniref:laccase n=1 Tax=Hirsutella rhossiliensis TaxID=111463 RepID=A0A9P8MQZ5_9HYPO|nr:multicopper oxidase domain-containing protein [Hirsutella rhossiliensis]KAH0958874.1 multicopper oxidase domain-containing protein [Hirsutella rhossiliensis]